VQIEDQTTTFIYNSNHSLSLAAQRDKLPIARYKREIFFALENFQTLILVGETASGKSTQLPQFLHEMGWHAKGMIGITQPRRIPALTLAQRVSEEMGDVLGGTVGVSIRFLTKCGTNTYIKFMTEGILLREMLADPLLSSYGVVMIDEVHERNVLTDCVLGLLKKIAKKRPALKIIIASATLDAEQLRDFFNFKPKEPTQKTEAGSATILTVQGRMWHNEMHYLREPCADYVRATVDTILKIHQKEKTGDILAFLTGQDEVLTAMATLRDHMETLNIGEDELKVLPMHGALTHHDQLRVFFRVPGKTRKVIIATNIAETSVTIPGNVYVIDCGFIKLKWFHADSQTESLVVVPASKATCKQRAGRSGRVTRGKVYRLFTELEYSKLPTATPPEMRRSDLCAPILHLKALGVDNVLRFDFPSPPPAKNMLASIEILYALNALDESGDLTSPLGYFMAEMPTSPQYSKMIWASCEMECSDEVISIVAMLQVQNVFSRPTSGQGSINARIARRNFEVAEGDLITLLNVYQAFVANKCTKEFCGKNYVMYRHLKRAHEIRGQLSSLLTNTFGKKLVSCGNDSVCIRKAITAGLFPFACYLHHSGVYKTVRGDMEVSINPVSCLYTERQPSWILFCEIQHTTKLFVKDITVIEQQWLLEVASHYYHRAAVRSFE